MAARPLVRSAAAGVMAVSAVASTAGPAQAEPIADYQMPFACTEVWTGSTRSYHSPSSNAVDFNRTDDLGAPVLAAEAGVVTSVTDLGNRSYGKYVKIAHGNDESTLYAHLDAMYVFPWQRVDQGQVIGTLGSSGGSTGPHLHFEERSGSSVVTPYFDGVAFRMPRTQASANCVTLPLPGDWNNTGKSNLGLFQRSWDGSFVMKIGKRVLTAQLGRGIDWPLVGDWDGNGTTDLGVRKALGGGFWLQRPDGTLDKSIRIGGRRHVGVAGDWDGNGRTDVGIWRPGSSDFRLRLGDGTFRVVDLGTATTLPVTGDFDGDGRDDVGVYDAATAAWSWSGVTSTAQGAAQAGMPYELPVATDWNGDGTVDLGTWDRDTGRWTLSIVQADGTVTTRTRYYGAPS